MKYTLFAVLVALVPVASACSDDAPGSDPDAAVAGDPDALPQVCDPLWSVETIADATATVDGGRLVLDAASLPAGCDSGARDADCANAIRVSQSHIVGEFEVVMDVYGLDIGVNGGFVQISLVSIEDSSRMIWASIGTTAEAEMFGDDVIEAGSRKSCFHAEDTSCATSLAGGVEPAVTLTLGREGDNYTSGGGTIFPDNEVFRMDEQLELSIHVGSAAASDRVGQTSMMIETVTVTEGGGDIVSESFDCDTLGG